MESLQARAVRFGTTFALAVAGLGLVMAQQPNQGAQAPKSGAAPAAAQAPARGAAQNNNAQRGSAAGAVPARTAANLRIAPMMAPGGKVSTEPQFTMNGDRVFMSWLEGDEDHAALRYAERTASTASGWSAARTVHSGTNMNVNAYDLPSVMPLADKTIDPQGTEKKDDEPEASTLKVTFSKDQGRTWTRAISPYADKSQTGHGFVSLFQAPGDPT